VKVDRANCSKLKPHCFRVHTGKETSTNVHQYEENLLMHTALRNKTASSSLCTSMLSVLTFRLTKQRFIFNLICYKSNEAVWTRNPPVTTYMVKQGQMHAFTQGFQRMKFRSSKIVHLHRQDYCYWFQKSFNCNRPWRLIGLWDVKASTFSLGNRLKDGGQVVSLRSPPLFTPQEDS
jgi:hypothetical protein